MRVPRRIYQIKKETKIELNQAGRKPEPKPEPEEDVVLPKILLEKLIERDCCIHSRITLYKPEK